MKKLFPNRITFSLRFWLCVIFLFGVISRVVFMNVYYPKKTLEQAVKHTLSEASSFGRLAAFSSEQAVRMHDSLTLGRVVKELQLNRSIRFIVITDSLRTPIASYDIDAAALWKYQSVIESTTVSENQLTVISKYPIYSENLTIGFLYIGFSLDDISREVDETKNNVLVIAGIILLIGIPFVWFISYLLIKPFDRMIDTVKNIAQGITADQELKPGYSEIKHLTDEFNDMVKKVTAAQEELRIVNRSLEMRIDERTKDLQLEIHQRKKTEEDLRISEERFRALVELSPDAIVVYTEETFLFINSSAFTMFRMEPAKKISERFLLESMHSTQAEVFELSLNKVLHEGMANFIAEYTFMRVDGTEFIAEVAATRFIFEGKNAIQIVIRDISERFKSERQRLELEQQLFHIQKKEIIGTLASGIAHDILNILGIIGTAINKLLFLKNIDQKSLLDSAEQISKATDRGRALVKQLLTFAKKTELNFDVTQINNPVSEIVNIIQRTFPSTIAVDAHLGENLPPIRVDNNQLHQALLNLSLNARDAIQGNGTISIETSMTNRVSFNGSSGKNGEYICISVSDDGIGMEPDVMKKIYEPFFTTKDEGTGSGLGLAMVKGIIENHRGFIEVESKPGKGTTFRLYLPV